MRTTLMRAGLLLGLSTIPAVAFAQKALVYCPTADQSGCNVIVNALSSGGGYPGGVDKAYDGTGGTLDLRTLDHSVYSVFVVPSLADDATTQPYALLRDPAVVEHLKTALIGGIAVWSGFPDQGTTNRTSKDQLIRNLAQWAGASYAEAHGPGLVALLDLSEVEGARYDWLRAITPLQITSDVTSTTYDSVRTLTATGAAIRGSLAYASMAALGLATPTPTPGLRIDALGATGTSTGGQVVLATLAAGNTSTAKIWTDALDYTPGQTVTIHGSGWAAGEAVTITLHEDPLLEQDSSWVAVSDGFGNLTSAVFAPDQNDIGTRFVLTADGGTSGMRAQATFTDAGKFWVGCASTDWNTANNWSTSATGTCTGGVSNTGPGVPLAGDGATITTGRANYPVISSGSLSIQTVTINSGGSVTVSGGTLTTSGDFTNNGTLTVSSGTLALGNDFLGSGSTTMSGGTLKVDRDFRLAAAGVTSWNANVTGGTVEFTAGANGDAGQLTGVGVAGIQFINMAISGANNAKLDNGAETIKIKGNLTYTNTNAGAGTIGATAIFNGSGSQTISGTQTVPINNLTNQNTNGLTASTDIIVDAALDLTAGNLTMTGSSVITVGADANTGSVTGGYVIGKLKKFVQNSTTLRTFEVGTASFSAPLSLDFTGGGLTGASATSSFFVASANAGEHASIGTAGINSARDVNIFWSVMSGGNGSVTTSGYKVKATFPATAIDAGSSTSLFIIPRFLSPNWIGTTSPVRTATSTQGSVTFASSQSLAGGTAVGDFAVGEPAGSTPTVTVTSGANPSVFGQSVTFTATAAYGGAPVTEGKITFRDGGSDCSTGTIVSGPTTVDVNGQATYTTSSLSVGGHTIRGCYSDAPSPNFATSNGTVAQTVNKANTATAVTSNNNPSVFGQSVTFTATVSAVAPGAGTATGTVTFKDGATTLGTGTLNGSGQATFSTSSLSVATHTITAEYGGDSNFNTSSGALSGGQVVNPASTTTSVTSNNNPSVFGQSVTFTATVSVVAPGAGTPTGTVTFKDGATTLGTGTLNGSGQATFMTAALSVATHSITASYATDGNFASSTSSSLSQVVNPASTTTGLTSSDNPSVFGQSVTFTATVSVVAPGAGTPTGTVTFKDGATTLGTGTLNGSGQATFTSSAFSVATHSITASYATDGNFASSASGALSQVVNPASTTTTISSDMPDPSLVGQSVVVNYSVAVTAPGAGTPTGSVTVSNGTTSCTGTVGAGTCSLTFTTAGSHPLTATYAGDANFTGSASAAEPHTVDRAPTTTAIASDLPDPSVVGQSVTVNYTVTSTGGTPTGNVTVSNGTTSCSGTVAAGTCSLTFTTAGSHPLTASYAGDANFDVSTSASEPHTVSPAATTTAITSDNPDPSVVGQAVTVQFSVTVNSPGGGTPTGNVTVSDGTTSCTGTVAAGQCSLTFTSAGAKTLTATYAGDGNFSGSASSGEDAHQVNQAATTTAISSDTPDPSAVGQSVTINYSVTTTAPGAGTPTGNVTVSNGTTSCTGTVAGGSCNITFTTAGSHPLTATYAGDANFATSTSAAEPHTVNAASTTTAITSDSPDPSVVGQSVAVHYTVTSTGGTPTGNVTVSDGTISCTGTVAAGTCSLTFTSAGAKTLTATYAGDGNFSGSTSAGEAHTVNAASTTTAITSDTPDPSVVGQSVTVNYSVAVAAPGAGTPTGNVTVSDGTVSCTGTVAAGTCSITFTSTGAKTLTATYAGSANFSGSTSAGEPHTVNTSDNQPPIVSGTLALPVAINSTGQVTANVNDVATGNSNIVSAYFTVDAGSPIAMTAVDGSFNSPNENVKGTIPSYSTPDVKEICVYGTDAAGNTGHECVLLAIYDPSQGFVTGGGWIMTPAGSYTPDVTLSGKATFGFVSKYLKGANTPTGNTEFQFHVANMNFSSSVYEWLVVSGAMAQYKGSGTINGAGNYGFLLTAVDGQLTGGGGTDKFRMKIWDKATNVVVYDNNIGATDTSTPSTVIAGGSIQIKAK